MTDAPARTLDEDDIDIDVCQHCGAYFVWTEGQRRAALQSGWRPERDVRPQRCIRCLVDECWIERDDDGQPTEQQEWADYDPDC